jgi:ABC-2 type transport system permease protein
MLRTLHSSLSRELNFLRRNPWDLALVSWMPLLVIVFMGCMFLQGVPRNIPVVLVDQDGSALSRQLARLIEATPGANTVRTVADLTEAQSLVRQGDAFAAVWVPPGAEEASLRGEQATLYVFFNNAYYTAGNLAARAIVGAVGELNVQRSPSPDVGNRVVRRDTSQGPPLQAQLVTLFNPQGSYEWSLLLAIFPALLLLMCSAAVLASILRELSESNRAGWIADGGSLTGALTYKVFFYSVPFTVFSLLTLVWLHARGWPVRSSVALTVLAQWLLYMGYGAIMAIFAALARGNNLTALSLCSLYASPALAFGDALFPVNTASLFVRTLSALLPYTPYVQLQSQQVQAGVSLADSLPFLLHLAAFTIIGLPLACWMHANAARPAKMVTT